MIDQNTLRYIEKLSITFKRKLSSRLLGLKRSHMHGQGLEFSEVREYTPGDDVRFIDWNVTARMQQPFIKVFTEEREMSVFILLDTSRSMLLAQKMKAASEMTALLAAIGRSEQDRVGLITFSNKVHTIIPARKRSFWPIMSALRKIECSGDSTSMLSTVETLNSLQKKPAMIFIISDFMFASPDLLAKKLSVKHQLICAQVYDEQESHISNDMGVVRLRDLESQKTQIIDGKNLGRPVPECVHFRFNDQNALSSLQRFLATYVAA